MARLAAVLIALCLWPLLATAALAHAVLLEAQPAPGTVLEAMIPRITLTFSEPISPMAFRLIAPDSGIVELMGTAAGALLAIDMPGVQQAGTYFVEWHVVSADGHPVAGSIPLSLGAPSKSDGAPALGDPLVRAGLWLATVFMFAGAFFGIGSAAFAAFLPPSDQSRLVLLPLLMAAIGVIASIPFHGAETLGLPISALIDPATWRTSFGTTYGAQAIGIGFAILLAAIATRLRGAVAPALGVVALVVLCVSLLLSGHVSTAEPRWLALAALAVHIAGFSFWIGALPLLFVALARPSDKATAVLATFSRLIVYVIALIITSGIVLAALQLGAPGPAWLAPYGCVLAAKLGILVVLFAVAAWNRFVLTRPTLAGDATATRRLRALVVAEIALVLVVLGVVGLWRFTPPPRVLATVEQPAAPASSPVAQRVRTHLHALGIMAEFEMVDVATSPRAIVELYPETDDADIRAVTIRLAPPVGNAVPLMLEASRSADGTWTADTPPLSEGRWTVQLEIRVGDFDLAKLKGALRIGHKGARNAD
jgi:copper transport protein